MPRESFEVTVEQHKDQDKEVAIASAAKYLAYADQSDTFGYGDVFSASVDEPRTESKYQVRLHFSYRFGDNAGLKRFMDEMAQLAKVRNVERVLVD